MIEECFDGIIVPSGLNLPSDYECGHIIANENIAELNEDRVVGYFLDVGICSVGGNTSEVSDKLKGSFNAYVKEAERRGISWLTGVNRLWREYFNFVRSEQIKSRERIPYFEKRLSFDRDMEVVLKIHDLTLFDVRKKIEELSYGSSL